MRGQLVQVYPALQRNLKKIPDLRNTLSSGNKNHFYLPTSKSIIPQNAHSRLIKMSWENTVSAKTWSTDKNSDSIASCTEAFGSK
ncbi:hypothetical protein HX021_16325 [Sphingobacterium sp. N143]|uniref:hypothetical protein n=1 Tax=Sphingobacterium sp. N143 TaxID=2746727 RepID=UPI0025774A35|nr:hypothetical protein [Sphingobacterium sp. N143]MDM1295857.1 hypothetical protein [Sphingobacterium sp. N143]